MKGPDRSAIDARVVQDEYDEAEMDRLRQRRDDARWYIVAGVAGMFAGAIHIGIAVGGALSALFGAGSYIYWSDRMRRLYDPWHDEELERWEEEEMQR